MVLDTVGIQSKGCFSKQKEGQNNITAFIIDETLIQIDYTNDDTDDDDDAWLWVVIVAQPIHYNRIFYLFQSTGIICQLPNRIISKIVG